MGITKTISLTNWSDLLSGAGNPIAEAEIFSLAGAGELLVEDDGHTYFPLENDGKWELVRVLTEQDVAKWLGVNANEAHRLLREAQVPRSTTRQRLFTAEPLWRQADIEAALRQHATERGLTEREASLELGLKIESYRQLRDSIPHASHGRVLKVLLEAYRNRYLPRDKIWSTRTSLLQEFVENYNHATSGSPLELQVCDVPGCGHVASDQCCNPRCRPPEEPRFLCPAHAEWVDIADSVRRPPSLCPTCATAVRSGQLGGFRLM